MATPITNDLRAMGIGVDEPVADTYALDMNDPDTAALIASFEAQAEKPADIWARMNGEAAETPAEGQETAPATDEGQSQLPPPAPGSTPVVPSSGDPLDGVEPDPDPEPAPSSWVVDLGNGASAELDQESARRLVALGQWAQTLPEQTRLAMNAVETGQAIAIPRDEHQAYLAWKAGGQPSTPAHTAPGASTPPPFDPEDADPATLALYREVQALRAQQDQQFQNETARLTADQDANLQRFVAARSAVFETEWATAGAAMNLSDAEINQALQYAAETQMIAQANRELTVFSPTGTVVRESDAAQIARTVIERAVYAIPSLRDKAIQATVDARLETERAAIIRTNEKKSRAGSLASAPSAATTAGRDPRSMTPMEREAAIANELRIAMNA